MTRPGTMDFFELQKENRRRSRRCYRVFQFLFFAPAVAFLSFSLGMSIFVLYHDPANLEAIIVTVSGILLIGVAIWGTIIYHALARNVDGHKIATQIGGVRLRRPTNSLPGTACLRTYS